MHVVNSLPDNLSLQASGFFLATPEMGCDPSVTDCGGAWIWMPGSGLPDLAAEMPESAKAEGMHKTPSPVKAATAANMSLLLAHFMMPSLQVIGASTKTNRV
jgi:hypothetical protein